MVQTISKLEKLLYNKGYKPKNYYIIHGICSYIELCIGNNSDNIMLSMNSSYTIKMEPSSRAFKLYSIKMGEEDDTRDNFAGKPNEDNIEKIYEEIDAKIEPSSEYNSNDKDIASKLEESYKKEIYLHDLNENDIKELRCIYRQLKRLKFCMQSIRYKLSIFYKNYLCILERDNLIDCYKIKSGNNNKTKKFFILSDLELFFEKTENNSFSYDISNIKNSLYKILDKNQKKHTLLINHIIEEKANILEKASSVELKKGELVAYMNQFNNLLENILETEGKLINDIHSIDKNSSNISGYKALHNDSEKYTQKHSLESELRNVRKIKEELNHNIYSIKEKYDNMILDTDTIIFDNVVMLDAVFKNIGILSKI